jgi:hypothetical protein
MITHFFFFPRGVSLMTYVVFFNVVMYYFAMGFGPSHQGFLVVEIIHGGMTTSL